MWRCSKCSESVEDNFDVCWNCGTSTEGVEDAAFDRSAEHSPAEEREPRAETLTCPKCKSDKIIPRVRIMDRGQYGIDAGNLTVVFYEDPGALVFKGAHQGSLFARVCGECAYTEMFLENAEDLYALYREREDPRKASEEEGE